MHFKKLLVIVASSLALSSCALVKAFEDNIEVRFEYYGEVIETKTVHQFKNCFSPELSSSQIPFKHEFFGWTWLNPDSIDIKSTTLDELKTKYIEKDDVVRYDDVKPYSVKNSITLKPLFFHEDDIPIPNYYIAIGWYAKTSTSGLNEERVNNWVNDLNAYLMSEGATSEDINNVKITPYNGDVATAGSLINKDRYNDLLIGFGNNINTTAGVEIIEKKGGIVMGGKERYIARLTEKDIAIKVYNWLQTEDGNKALR